MPYVIVITFERTEMCDFFFSTLEFGFSYFHLYNRKSQHNYKSNDGAQDKAKREKIEGRDSDNLNQT